MTVRQMQWQLYLLGYYPTVPDGEWGIQSIDGTMQFQREYGLIEDGIFGENTHRISEGLMMRIQKVLGVCEDGLGNVVTQGAISLWQREHDLFANGIADAAVRAMLFKEEIRHFRHEEFRCKCGGRFCDGFPAEPDERLATLPEKMQTYFRQPITILKGVCCEKYNRMIGGKKNSLHLYGTAADIAVVSGATPQQMAEYMETLLPNTGGIGIYDWGIHVDVRRVMARWKG